MIHRLQCKAIFESLASARRIKDLGECVLPWMRYGRKTPQALLNLSLLISSLVIILICAKENEGRLEDSSLISYVIIYDLHFLVLDSDEISNSTELGRRMFLFIIRHSISFLLFIVFYSCITRFSAVLPDRSHHASISTTLRIIIISTHISVIIVTTVNFV